MAIANTFNISFDSSIKRSERKVAGPTVNLVRDILTNAGMDEGNWSLRDSRRIKKKGRERFHAIRIEERGGRRAIRIWCKPGGNDSCFEYTLVPPPEVDTNVLFSLLRRVNPVNLQIPESAELPLAFVRHVVDAEPKTMAPAPIKHEIKEEEKDLPPEAEAEIKEAVMDLDRRDHGLTTGQVAEAVSPSMEATSLAIDESVLMSEQEVMDKALLAIESVAPNGYARKTEASNSIIENLGIKRFVGEVSGGIYTSVEGAMRALTMALRSSGYLERVHYTSEDGGVSKGIKGYKLTPKAMKRIALVKSVHGAFLPTQRVWTSPHAEYTDAFQEELELESEATREAQNEIQKAPGDYGLNSEDLPRLKSLIAQHEEADLQLKEIDGILRNLDSEIADIELDETGLDLAEQDKMRQIEALQGDIQRLREKKTTVRASLERKRKERKEWEDMRSPHLSEKSRAESEICAITGRSKK